MQYNYSCYLAFSGEDVEDNVAGSGPEFDTLGVEDLLSEVRGGDNDEVALPHAEEEDVAEFLGEVGEVAVVEVIADLDPVAEDGDRDGPRRQLEAPAAEHGYSNGKHCRDEEAREGLLQEEEIHGCGWEGVGLGNLR